MSARLLDLYKSILATCWMVTDAQGNVYNAITVGGDDETKTFALVDGKRLVMPTEQQLAVGDPDNKIVFHPLSEQAMKGESLVVTKLRRAAAARINWTISNLVLALVQMGASHAEHHKLTPSQSGILSALKEADETTINDVKKMLSAATTERNITETFYSLFLRRGAKIGGKTYARGGIVTFPFYEELKKTQERYFGIKLRKKDRLALITLFESILPGIENAENYCVGVDNNIAPFMEALMRTIAKIGGEINAQVELYASLIPEADKCIIESDWEEAFNHLGNYQGDIRSIPPQAGNEGMDKRQDVLAAEQAIKPAATRPVVQPQAAAPVAAATVPILAPYAAAPPQYQPAVPTVNAKGARNYAEDLKRFQAQQQQGGYAPQPQPQYYAPAPQPQYDPWGRPIQQPMQYEQPRGYAGYYNPPAGGGGGGGYGNGGRGL